MPPASPSLWTAQRRGPHSCALLCSPIRMTIMICMHDDDYEDDDDEDDDDENNDINYNDDNDNHDNHDNCATFRMPRNRNVWICSHQARIGKGSVWPGTSKWLNPIAENGHDDGSLAGYTRLLSWNPSCIDNGIDDDFSLNHQLTL